MFFTKSKPKEFQFPVTLILMEIKDLNKVPFMTYRPIHPEITLLSHIQL